MQGKSCHFLDVPLKMNFVILAMWMMTQRYEEGKFHHLRNVANDFRLIHGKYVARLANDLKRCKV